MYIHAKKILHVSLSNNQRPQRVAVPQHSLPWALFRETTVHAKHVTLTFQLTKKLVVTTALDIKPVLWV